MFAVFTLATLFSLSSAVIRFFPTSDSLKFAGIKRDLQSQSFEDDIIKFVSDLINRTQPSRVGFIIDSVYEKYIDEIKLNRETMFTILNGSELIEDAPRDEVQAMLIAMKEITFKMYFILITNGAQMRGFLKYVDYHRLLDFNANIVMLHDYRLFSPDLHYLWKRIVNVIFIRKTDMKEGRNWYELSTVPFPRKIHEIFVSRTVNYWSPPNKLRFRKEIFQRKSDHQFDGEIFKVLVLPHAPTVFKTVSENGSVFYSGLEIDLLSTVSSVMNFTIEYYESSDSEDEKWGRQYGQSNFSGLYGEMENAEADIALGDLHYTNFHLKIMDLTVPYYIECLTFITPEVLNDNTWKTLILPFSPGMWTGVLISLVLVGVFFFLFSNVYRFLKNGKNVEKKNVSYFYRDFFDDLSNCVLYTYSMILLVSLPRLPLRWSVRVLTGWWWIYCVLVVVAYRASLTSILANPQPKLTIDTLEVLAQSSLKCGAWGDENRNLFSTSTDPTSKKIGEKIEHVDDANDAIYRVAQGDFAYYESRLALQQLRYKHEVQQMGAENLHIMDQCAINMPISIGLEKNSAIKEQFSRYIRRAIESGLIEKWLKSATMSFESSIEPPPAEALMDIKKFYGALVALACGFFLALLAFASEKLYWRFFVETHPHFDRYLKIIRVTSYTRIPKIPEQSQPDSSDSQ